MHGTTKIYSLYVVVGFDDISYKIVHVKKQNKTKLLVVKLLSDLSNSVGIPHPDRNNDNFEVEHMFVTYEVDDDVREVKLCLGGNKPQTARNRCHQTYSTVQPP